MVVVNRLVFLFASVYSLWKKVCFQGGLESFRFIRAQERPKSRAYFAFCEGSSELTFLLKDFRVLKGDSCSSDNEGFMQKMNFNEP